MYVLVSTFGAHIRCAGVSEFSNYKYHILILVQLSFYFTCAVWQLIRIPYFRCSCLIRSNILCKSDPFKLVTPLPPLSLSLVFWPFGAYWRPKLSMSYLLLILLTD